MCHALQTLRNADQPAILSALHPQRQTSVILMTLSSLFPLLSSLLQTSHTHPLPSASQPFINTRPAQTTNAAQDKSRHI